jgi:hypothetical protein
VSSRIGKRLTSDAVFTTKALATTAASAIPVLGGPIATAIGIWEGERISRRVETFIEEMQARVSKLEREKLDKNYVETEAFQDATISALQAAKRSSSRTKREWIAAILLGSATTNRPPDLDADALLDLVGTLSEAELLILQWAWLHKDSGGMFHSVWLPAQLQGVDYDFRLSRLGSFGLIGYKADRPVAGSYDWRIFGFTNTFRRLMSAIQAGGGLSEST